MEEPIWMDKADAVIFHDMELAAHGGSTGIRDEGLLESALSPQDLWAYSEKPPTLTQLAAAYALGISSSHAFVDGNERTAFAVSFTLLDINGIAVTASQEDAYLTILALASGDLSEEQLADWFARNTGPLGR